jgi:hypothetical protein
MVRISFSFIVAPLDPSPWRFVVKAASLGRTALGVEPGWRIAPEGEPATTRPPFSAPAGVPPRRSRRSTGADPRRRQATSR